MPETPEFSGITVPDFLAGCSTASNGLPVGSGIAGFGRGIKSFSFPDGHQEIHLLRSVPLGDFGSKSGFASIEGWCYRSS